MGKLDESLSKLKGTTPIVAPGFTYPNPEEGSIQLTFPNGTVLNAEYWRVLKDGNRHFSSFDHLQIYGLPERIDAVKWLQDLLESKQVTEAHLESETGDLHFGFAGSVVLQVFNFTAYEIWQIHFPDGAVEYSNHI